MRINTETQLNQTDILFMQSMANYTMVHTLERKYLSSRTLKVMTARIDPEMPFIKIKRGLLINKQYIEKFNDDVDEAYVLLVNGKKLPISRRLFTKVKKGLDLK
jgi:DNA-binding LytR/AlgR family response regulator